MGSLLLYEETYNGENFGSELTALE